ncbi:enoyl-CoA hydratase/isomerase family protein [Syntrophorhabdus aromaticivorans]|uniref:Enoyl-CoA hydratase/isomerase family protein n=1 Tax=Syntrophorhabdus aromaticivorans TaxID=328301 RepID=A0A351U755_9BACT|nr:enoyl-CoA hydratase/isomerase family protein [Syntrophorhabdus aromaticivorans]NLW35572.1 enoyl-CoA hydratase/isomerase family protein [Syntrophorhabdus aromaticivorans]HBA55786.1 enoyl-CoA hydratase/isomerase family protein [Syntrophorhabdus aromaticivorans]
MGFNHIVFEKKDKVAKITLNVPPSNWLTIVMMKEINEALLDIKKDGSLQMLIFDHAGEKAFCDGVDVADHTEDRVDEMIEVFHGMFRRLAELDLTTVAVVNGRSLGGGCELMSFCDIVVASEKSRIGQPEIAVGVYPPVAAAWFPKIIGLQKTYELLLTGKIINAKEAQAIGLVTAVLPVENFKEEVEKYLADFLNKSRPVAMWTKRAIKAGLSLDFLQALKASEIIYNKGCMATEDAKEGISAFMEKRKAVWKDK